MIQKFMKKQNNCTMEYCNHSKNKTSLENLTSRKTFLLFSMLLFVFGITSCDDKKNEPGIYYESLVGSMWEGYDSFNAKLKLDFLSENEVRWTYTDEEGAETTHGVSQYTYEPHNSQRVEIIQPIAPTYPKASVINFYNVCSKDILCGVQFTLHLQRLPGNTTNNNTDEGVEINGVIWATRNVGEVAGTFANNIEDLGGYYQWNRNKPWKYKTDSDVIQEENNFTPSGTKWTKANDPSPEGWRVPSFDEMASLLDDNRVSREFLIRNETPGIQFTDKKTGQKIFFPMYWYNLSEGEWSTYESFGQNSYWTNAYFSRYYDDYYHSLEIRARGYYHSKDNIDDLQYSAKMNHFGKSAYLDATDIKRTIMAIRSVKDDPNYPLETTDKGVVINGVTWATRNIDAPGTFANSSRAYSKIYQWNRIKAWRENEYYMNTGYDPLEGWDKSYSNSTIWEKVNDPSPEGWSIATKEDFESLLNKDKVDRYIYSGVGNSQGTGFNGILFRDKDTGNTVWFPANGDISQLGYERSINFDGNYYSSSPYYSKEELALGLNNLPEHNNAAYAFVFLNGSEMKVTSRFRNYGFTLRCVKK